MLAATPALRFGGLSILRRVACHRLVDVSATHQDCRLTVGVAKEFLDAFQELRIVDVLPRDIERGRDAKRIVRCKCRVRR